MNDVRYPAILLGPTRAIRGILDWHYSSLLFLGCYIQDQSEAHIVHALWVSDY